MIFIVKRVKIERFSSLTVQATTPPLTPIRSRNGGAQTAKVHHHQEDCQAQTLTPNTQQLLSQLL